MGGAPDAPTPIDPNVIIDAQTKANRINRITPFGSQIYGPNGLETQLNPKMQHLVDKQMDLANKDLQPLQAPAGFGQLQNKLMQNQLGGNGGAKGAMQQLPQLQQMSNGFAGNPQNPQNGNNPIMAQVMQNLQRKF